ncbi:MAG: NTP transferase domain-containing protein, partial [Candidatus Tectomicrobia bacterium]|nr:NTP transferase domain-containing protein [Candidatus Tectomicrobia bacterium]
MQDLAGVTAAILAGGLGTRLRAVVADRPKVLAEVQGWPFLAYLLDQLVEAGVKEVVLCTGYLGEQVQALFGDRYNG